MKHFLYSQDLSTNVAYFDRFDKDEIKNAIFKHLGENPNDTIEHCKEYNKRDIKRYYGNEIINFYQNNKSGVPSLVVTRGSKEYFKSLAQ